MDFQFCPTCNKATPVKKGRCLKCKSTVPVKRARTDWAGKPLPEPTLQEIVEGKAEHNYIPPERYRENPDKKETDHLRWLAAAILIPVLWIAITDDDGSSYQDTK